MLKDKINKIKKEKRITNDMLAELSGIPKSTLAKITSGKTPNPKLETVRAIANVLGCTLDDLNDDYNKYETNFKENSVYDLTKNEQELIDNYRNLTEKGQEKLTEYTVDLLSAPKYNRHNTNDIIYENAYKKFKNYPEEQEDNIG